MKFIEDLADPHLQDQHLPRGSCCKEKLAAMGSPGRGEVSPVSPILTPLASPGLEEDLNPSYGEEGEYRRMSYEISDLASDPQLMDICATGKVLFFSFFSFCIHFSIYTEIFQCCLYLLWTIGAHSVQGSSQCPFFVAWTRTKTVAMPTWCTNTLTTSATPTPIN